MVLRIRPFVGRGERRPIAVRPRRGCSTSVPATTPPPSAAQSLGIAARQDPAHRPAPRSGRRPVHGPGRQPVRHAVAESGPTGCATRGASVRPDDRRPLIGDVGASAQEEVDLRPGAQRRPRDELGWDYREGLTIARPAGACFERGFVEPIFYPREPHDTHTARSPAATSCATRASAASTAATSTRTPAATWSGRSFRAPGGLGRLRGPAGRPAVELRRGLVRPSVRHLPPQRRPLSASTATSRAARRPAAAGPRRRSRGAAASPPPASRAAARAILGLPTATT